MKSLTKSELFRELPSVDELLRRSGITSLVRAHGATAATDAARWVLSRLREQITSGLLDHSSLQIALEGLPRAVEKQIRTSLGYSLRPVINATGVILHTNLGRAVAARPVLDHVSETATSYSNLEFDLATGERGKRDVHVDRLFQKLLAENVPDRVAADGPAVAQTRSQGQVAGISTIVVNNNAAAVLLALNTLAEGGEVIVSRGELVEIGGSFRIPEVMAKSGAILREVGTTNCTRASDYERAITEKTRLLLKVHRSNFQITGFTEQPSLSQLTHLAHSRGIPVMEDLGSGALFDLRSVGVDGERGVLESLNSEVDV